MINACDNCIHNQTNPQACKSCHDGDIAFAINPKITTGKLQLTKVLPVLVEQIADIRMRGDAKYGIDSWKNVPREQWVDGIFRHLLELLKGETINAKDWGHHHAAHIACACMFILDIDK
jgi:hypothetical protein